MTQVDVAIVGAGFAGLGAAIQLGEAGFRVLVLEADAGLGGTWRANQYPGCACDIPSHLYSFSFEPKADWSHLYGRQPEILAYLEDVAERRGLKERIRFDTQVRSARWDESNTEWILETAGDLAKSTESIRATHLVLGTGPLRNPRIPHLPGQEHYQGPKMHTAQFDPDVPLEGKHVAIIGTGASAIQVVPSIADRVKSLTIYQRTPPWILPRGDRRRRDEEKTRFRRWPVLARLWRAMIFLRQEMLGLAFYGWSKLGARARARALANLQAAVPDPELRRALTPGYAPGCKRVLLSDDYYPALLKDHVELVARGASAFTKEGVVDAEGRERPADVVIYGTGFDLDALLAPLEVYGVGGQALSELWSEAPRAHLGITVPGFPNLFVLLGPNTGLGHNSVVLMAEAQIRYVRRCLEQLRDRGQRRIEVRRDVFEASDARIQRRLEKAVWSLGGCTSWYVNDQGRNVTLWPGSVVEYWLRTRRPRWADFQIGHAPQPAPAPLSAARPEAPSHPPSG